MCLVAGASCLDDGDCQDTERCHLGSCRRLCLEGVDCQTGTVCRGGLCLSPIDGGVIDASSDRHSLDGGHDAGGADRHSLDVGRDAGVADRRLLDGVSDVARPDRWIPDATCDAAQSDVLAIRLDGGQPIPLPILYALEIVGEVIVDGGFPDIDWSPALAVSFNGGYVGSNNAVQVRARWNGDQLFLHFDIEDDAVIPDQGSFLWNEDGAEFVLDTWQDRALRLQRDDLHVTVSAGGRVLVERGTGAEAGRDESEETDSGWVAWDVKTLDGGYTVEVALPWNKLGQIPAVRRTLGLLLANNDRDHADGGTRQFAWFAAGADASSFKVPASYGTLLLANGCGGF